MYEWKLQISCYMVQTVLVSFIESNNRLMEICMYACKIIIIIIYSIQ